jgi:hypothetical protein
VDATTTYPTINLLERVVAGILQEAASFYENCNSSRVYGLMLSALWCVPQLHVYKEPVRRFREDKFRLKQFRLSQCILLKVSSLLHLLNFHR